VLVAVEQQDDRRAALEGLDDLGERLVHERRAVEPLEGQRPDPGEHLHADLAARELLGPAGRLFLGLQALAIHPDAPEKLLDLFCREGLHEVVVGLMAEPEDGGLHRGGAGDEDHGGRRLLVPDGLEQIESAQPRHLDVGHHQVEGRLPDELESLLGPGGCRDVTSIRGEDQGEEPEDRSVVVDEQGSEALRVRGHRGGLACGGDAVGHGFRSFPGPVGPVEPSRGSINV
jgi:hypothetical protein